MAQTVIVADDAGRKVSIDKDSPFPVEFQGASVGVLAIQDEYNISGTASAVGNNIILSAPGYEQRIVVTSFTIQNESGTATTMTLHSNVSSNDGWRFLGQNQGDELSMDFCSGREWRLGTNESLILNLSGANQCGYSVQYYIESVPWINYAAYYVDVTLGNDGNNGLSPADAWQTVAMVNASTFNPGDRILFKRGETWVGTELVVPSSGLLSVPITFGAYGEGANPIIDGNDAVDCIAANGHHYLTFENLECTQGFNFGIACNAVHGITVIECFCHDCGNDNLIFINACYDCRVSGGEFYNAYDRAGGVQPSGIEIADGSHNIIIDDAACYDQIDVGAGITVHSHALTVMPYNITITNCYCYDNAGIGIRFSKADAAVDTDRNILIQNNLTTGNALDGIRVTNTGAAYVNGATVLNNVCRLDTQWGISLSGIGILAAENEVVSASAGVQTCVALADCQASQCYNNTLHNTSAGFSATLNIGGAATANLFVRNNIISGNGVGANPYMVGVAGATGVVGMDIDYNLYMYTGGGARWTWIGANKTYAPWLLDSGQDANSPARADPLFVNAAANDFHLQAGSPARGVGIELGYGTDLGAYPYEA